MEMSNLPLLGAPQQTERRFTAWIVSSKGGYPNGG
jgi:hypothetical protein